MDFVGTPALFCVTKRMHTVLGHDGLVVVWNGSHATASCEKFKRVARPAVAVVLALGLTRCALVAGIAEAPTDAATRAPGSEAAVPTEVVQNGGVDVGAPVAMRYGGEMYVGRWLGAETGDCQYSAPPDWAVMRGSDTRTDSILIDTRPGGLLTAHFDYGGARCDYTMLPTGDHATLVPMAPCVAGRANGPGLTIDIMSSSLALQSRTLTWDFSYVVQFTGGLHENGRDSCTWHFVGSPTSL